VGLERGELKRFELGDTGSEGVLLVANGGEFVLKVEDLLLQDGGIVERCGAQLDGGDRAGRQSLQRERRVSLRRKDRTKEQKRTLSRRCSMLWLVKNRERNSSTCFSRPLTRSACLSFCAIEMLGLLEERRRIEAHLSLTGFEVGLRRGAGSCVIGES
jgi:hypothetical protein